MIGTRRTPSARLLGGVATLLTVLVAAAWVFPLYWTVATSLKPENDTIALPPTLWPHVVDTSAYTYIFQNSPLIRWYLNSVLTSVVITVLVLLLSMLCAYALSQLQFRGRKGLYWLVLAGFMLPFQASLVPLFMFLNDLGLVNSYAGLILPQLAAPVAVIIYKQFFDQIPPELGDAARMDGASEWRVLWSVFLPLNWNITVSLAIVTFIAAWNNFLLPFIVINDTPKLTIPVGITQVQSAYGVAYAKTMATAVTAALPTVIAYLIFQRRVTEGVMATSGLK
ncbi:carbohydrate ABC transporter permease [Deinococcus maricopensis]|uniref:ABC-type transporter, integral membrane subunit n=1 Tax=Deinococcus maricopensis (strain DSM 21211 / LMG 22137 / NRRL B-23946 / LB-34) TaxID=709986 RepID=E8U486_DEIML|nr:carbohydrate ABC transporter permease [Deinococcus maricopensis]ADV65923.1 ABC-type transporter, integral membrane subunit [Deinococcus maricopensis DSM 21211]